MRTIFLLLVTIVLSSSSCSTEHTNDHYGTLEIIFKATANSQPLVMYYDTLLTSNTPERIVLKKLDFFVADIKGKNASGETDFLDVTRINLGAFNQADAAMGHQLSIANIPVGSYTQLDMGIGLSDAVNNTKPSDYTSSAHPLQSNYWDNWHSYVFSKIEGRAIPNSGAPIDFLYHSGGNGMQQLRSFSKDFEISNGKTTQLIIHLETANLFFVAGNEVDLINEPRSESEGAINSPAYLLAKKVLENLANSLFIQ